MSADRKGRLRISSFGNSLGITGEDIVLIPLGQLHEFKDHPFHIHDDEGMEKLTESVKEQGVLVPILIRKLEEESYEIIAGHRRKHAAELAGFVEIPAIVKQMDDDEAVIAMVDSNLQREEILPSEKAFSYKMKLEALKHQGKRTDLTFFHDGEKLDAHQMIADDSGESKSQVFRFLRLTELHADLLQMTDRKEIGLVAACELSYLRTEEQEALVHVIERIRTMPSVKQAEHLKKLSRDGICTLEAIQAVLKGEPQKERRFVMKSKKLSEYFPEETTQEEIERIIFELLDHWRLENGETAR